MKRAAYTLALALITGLTLNAPAAVAAVTDEQVQKLIERIEAQDRRIAELEKAAQKPATAAPAPTAAVAAVPSPAAPAKPSPSAWAEKVTVQGDFRYRYENIDQETADSDRNRQRIRARAAIVAKPQDNLEVGFGLSTSQDGDPVSSNQTIGDGGSRKDIYLDLAYFNWAALDGLNVTRRQVQELASTAPASTPCSGTATGIPRASAPPTRKDRSSATSWGPGSKVTATIRRNSPQASRLGVAVPVSEGVKLTAGARLLRLQYCGQGLLLRRRRGLLRQQL